MSEENVSGKLRLEDTDGIQFIKGEPVLPEVLTLHDCHTDDNFILLEEWVRGMAEATLALHTNLKFPPKGYSRFRPRHAILGKILAAPPHGVKGSELVEFIAANSKGLRNADSSITPRCARQSVKGAIQFASECLPDDLAVCETDSQIIEIVRLHPGAMDAECLSGVSTDAAIKRAFEIAKYRLGGTLPGLSLGEYKELFGGNRYPLPSLQLRGEDCVQRRNPNCVTSYEVARAVAEVIQANFPLGRREGTPDILINLLLQDPRGISWSDLVRQIVAQKRIDRGDERQIHFLRVSLAEALWDKNVENSGILRAESVVSDDSNRTIRRFERMMLEPGHKFVLTRDAEMVCVRRAFKLASERLGPEAKPARTLQECLRDGVSAYCLSNVETLGGAWYMPEIGRMSDFMHDKDVARGFAEYLLLGKMVDSPRAREVLGFMLQNSSPEDNEVETSRLSPTIRANVRKANGEVFAGPSGVTKVGAEAVNDAFDANIILQRIGDNIRMTQLSFDAARVNRILPNSPKDFVASMILAVAIKMQTDVLTNITYDPDENVMAFSNLKFVLPEKVTFFGQTFEMPNQTVIQELFEDVKQELVYKLSARQTAIEGQKSIKTARRPKRKPQKKETTKPSQEGEDLQVA